MATTSHGPRRGAHDEPLTADEILARGLLSEAQWRQVSETALALFARGQALAAELGPAASFVRHDVTSEADWARAVEAAQKLGGLHGLVNNAGIYQPAALMETDDALWQRHIQINQYGCFLGMKAVVPAMERSGGGSIVNISSVAGLKGSPGSFAYAATKWALRGMTKSAAIDLGGRKIRVNSVHPVQASAPASSAPRAARACGTRSCRCR